MILKVNTWQRVMLVMMVGSLRGVNIDTIRKAGKMLDVFEFSEKDKKQVGFELLPNGDYKWSRTQEKYIFEIEIDERFISLLKQAFTQFEGWSMEHRDLTEDLAQQLGLEEPSS